MSYYPNSKHGNCKGDRCLIVALKMRVAAATTEESGPMKHRDWLLKGKKPRRTKLDERMGISKVHDVLS